MLAHRALAFLGLAAIACGSVACGGDTPAGPSGGGLGGIVILCVDTLRADMVRSPKSKTEPQRLASVAALAQEGVSFADATTTASWTGPALASAVTGLLPQRNGVGLGFAETGSRPMTTALTTLAESFRARGWHTTGCSGGGWVTPTQGFGQGFDYFSADFDLHEPNHFISEWAKRRPKDKPFFLFLHTYAAHDPYGAKEAFYSNECLDRPEAVRCADTLIGYVNRQERIPPDLFADAIRFRWTDACSRFAIERRLGPEKLRAVYQRTLMWNQGGWREDPIVGDRLASHLRSSYEAGMSVVDYRVGQTMRALTDAGIPKDTAIVFFGDHGEAFGEGGQLYHGQSLHDAIMRVPLIVKAPGRLPAGKTIRGGCSLVDLMPTLLDLADIPALPALDGRSLLPLARGEAQGQPTVAEAHRGDVGESGNGEIGIVAVRTPTAKWILEYDLSNGTVLGEFLFDLVADPDETASIPMTSTAAQGTDFCLAVARTRNEVLGRFGIAPRPPSCALAH